MLRYRIEPRSSETNATGHIDHTVIPEWFELARTPIYQLFNPGMSFSTWNTVIRKIEIDYIGQVFHDRETEIRSSVGVVKNSSFQISQELWQDGSLVARGNTVLVYYDYKSRQKQTIPERIREQLARLL